MKKFIALLVALMCVFAVAFTACFDSGNNSGNTGGTGDGQNNNQTGGEEDGEDEEDPDHECETAVKWSHDSQNHWYDSVCPLHPDREFELDAHTFVNHKCTVCKRIEEYDIGDKLPEITVNTYNTSYTEGTYSTSEAAGKVLIINFWYVSCGICKDEMPHVEALYDEYGEENIQVLVLHKDNGEQGADAQSTINSQGWSNYRAVFGDDYKANGFDAIAKMVGAAGQDYPVTIVVGKDGTIVFKCLGNFMAWDNETHVTTNLLTPYIQAELAK